MLRVDAPEFVMPARPRMNQMSGDRRSKRNRPHAIPIIHPVQGNDVIEAMLNEEAMQLRSGDSSARETPHQPSAVNAELPRMVACSIDGQQPPSRSSNYSESEQQSEPETQSIPPPSGNMSPKNDAGGDMLGGGPVEPPLSVENNIGFPDIPMQGWPPHIQHMPSEPYLMSRMVVMPQPEPAEYPHMSGWAPNPNAAVCPQIGPASAPVVPSVPTPVGPAKKTETPVVSALAPGPPVDLCQFPALAPQRHGGGHQSPARNKRKTQRLEHDSIEIRESRPVVERIASPAPAVVPENVEPPVEVPAVPEEVPPQAQLPFKAPSPKPAVTAPLQGTQPSPAGSPHPSQNTTQEQETTSVALPPPQQTVVPVPARQEVIEPVAPISQTNKSSHQLEQPQQPPDAKSKNRAKKQRQEQRQATPPLPPQKSDPVEAPPQPQPVASPPAPTEPEKVRTPSPAPPAAPVTQIVVESQSKLVEMAMDSRDNRSEESLVAAMNAENAKISAAQETTIDSAPLENNNIPNNNVTVIIQPSSDRDPVIENSKPVLRHTYKEDQWSPLNLTGKKKYERDFIMKLMNDPQSVKRPDNLPNLEALKDSRSTPRDQGRGSLLSNRHGVDLMPSFGGKSRSGISLKRPSQTINKPKGKSQAPIQVTLSLNEDVKLRECDAPWKPARVHDHANMNEDDTKTDVLYKKVRGVLNKLTPQKFDTLVKQVQSLPIDTVPRLKGVIDLVFEKAVDEPGFSVAYADMCKVLEQMSVPDTEQPPKADGSLETANFRAILLTRCQKEFEKDQYSELDMDRRVKEIDDENDPEKKKDLQLQWDEDMRRARVKAVGNVRFVGELYKKKMITCNVMYTCVETLLNLNTEESLECLCKLLSTIGKQFDEQIETRKKEKKDNPAQYKDGKSSKMTVIDSKDIKGLDDYFSKFQELVKNKDKRLSNRVRFMIQDLIDLRNHKWVPRRDESKPKTMDQIAKDAEREQLENNLALHAPSHEKRSGRMDSRNNMSGGKQSSEWNLVSNSSRPKYVVEPDKMRLDQTQLQGDIKLGCMGQFRSWQPGSSADPRRKQQSQPQPQSQLTNNKFALLEEKSSSISSSLKGPMSSDMRSNPEKLKSSYSSVQDDPRNARFSQMGPGSNLQSNSNSASPEPSEQTPLSQDDNYTLTSVLLRNFITDVDYDDADKLLTGKFSLDVDKEAFICNIMTIGIDKNTKTRRGASKLLADFLMTSKISKRNICNGLTSFLSTAEDLMPDAPKLWEYLGEVTADIVTANWGLKPLLDMLSIPLVKKSFTTEPHRTVITVLRIIHEEWPESYVLKDAAPALKEFLGGPEAYERFVIDNKLEFLDNPTKEPHNEKKITEQLLRFFKRKTEFDQVTQWIECNLGPAMSEKTFIRALTTAIIEHCMVCKSKDVWNLLSDAFSKKIKLLQRYIDNPSSELHCLFALQVKLHELQHPRGALNEVCRMLHEAGIISTESFNKWKSEEEQQYSQGIGVCMSQLTSFFIWINEPEENS